MDFASRLFGYNPFDTQNSNAPVSGQQASTAAIAQPTLGQMYQDDLQQAQMGKLGNLGMLLLASGQQLTPAQRATILAQAPQYMDGAQRDAMTAAQARLMNMQGKASQDEMTRADALRQRFNDPNFVKSLGLSQDQAQALGPAGIQKLLENQAMANTPDAQLDRKVKMAQLSAASKPEWKITGQTEFGQPQYNLVAPNGQIVTPAGANGQQPGGGGSSVMDQVKGLQGKDVIERLKETNPGLANQVDAIASARVPFTTSLMKGPRGEMLESLVNMVDPNYSTTTFDTRKKTATGFASSTPGSAGGQVVFGNTAIKHLLELRKEVDDLNNYQGFPGSYYVNKMGNAGRESSGRSSNIARWKATSQNAADEIAKFYGAGGVEDRAKIHALFDPARGPNELRAVIDEQIKDLFAKTSNLENQYKEGMGPYAGNKKIIYDDTREELLKAYKKPDQPVLPPGVRSVTPIQ